METNQNSDVFIRLKDVDGNDVACPFDNTREAKPDLDVDWDECFETDVIGRYAGRIKIVDPVA